VHLKASIVTGTGSYTKRSHPVGVAPKGWCKRKTEKLLLGIFRRFPELVPNTFPVFQVTTKNRGVLDPKASGKLRLAGRSGFKSGRNRLCPTLWLRFVTFTHFLQLEIVSEQFRFVVSFDPKNFVFSRLPVIPGIVTFCQFRRHVNVSR